MSWVHPDRLLNSEAARASVADVPQGSLPFARWVAPLILAWLAHGSLSAQPLDNCELSVHWKVLANRGEEFDAELTLTNKGPGALPASGWRIYFNSARLLTLNDPTAAATLRHVNGDFFELSPGKRFEPVPPGSARKLSVTGADWAIKKSDAPAGFYLVSVDRRGETPRRRAAF